MPSVMGVNGTITDRELGFTLPHEHLFVDISCYCVPEPQEDELKVFYKQPVSLANRHQVIHSPWNNRDNAILNDTESATKESQAFAALGGKTIADLTACQSMGRDPRALRRVAELSGINVIMSSGRYTLPTLSDHDQLLSVSEVEHKIMDEFLNGTEDGIKPGLLKAGFVSQIDHPAEICTLRAVGRVQHKIGCAVAVHPYIWKAKSHLILDILEEEGCDLRKVILCHQDYLGSLSAYQNSLAKRGAYIEFDTFGCGWINDVMWQQTTQEKIGFLLQQVNLGNAKNLLISGDMCLKIMLKRWGGEGYAYIPQVVLPALRQAGFSEDLIDLITVENPARVFCH